MLSIVGAGLGLAGSLIPELIKIYKDRQDKKHELEIMRMQMEMAKEGHMQRLEEIVTEADVKQALEVYKFAPPEKPEFTGKWWFDILMLLAYVYNTTVRPTLTYLVIGGYIFFKYAQFQLIMSTQGLDVYQAITKVWNENDTMFVFLVVTFWMGSRQLLRSLGKLK
ncbi:MAG: hypothetical protein QW561_02525 [Candidatus Aenigmatarchaeota archaeon]